jgi:two-component system response regulator PilR (NtrC family)
VARVLLVDDERSMREFLEILLARQGHASHACATAREALVALECDEFDLVITDIQMPGMDGMELLTEIQARQPDTPVVMITAHGSTESAVEAMKRGAYDYLSKPCSVDEILLVVDKALEKRNLAHENERLRRQLRDRAQAAPSMLGESAPMRQLFELVDRVAPTRTNILISGESGTGKELVARTIHALSDQKHGAFVAVNCGAIPENLLESELFGHVKGSFTGAIANKMGLFEVADGGTLFLDEIGEMPVSLQVKVLRAIQERCFKRVGGTTDVRVDVRIVAATNRELDEEVRAGRFREDLYYRLNVIEVRLPPLRERQGDVAPLVRSFLARFAADLGKDVREIDAGALRALERYAFPGNVRELENLIERAVTLARGPRVTPECLPASVYRPQGANAPEQPFPEQGVELPALLHAFEERLIRQALERAQGVKKRAAALLGVSFRSLRYRLEKLGLDSGGDDE